MAVLITGRHPVKTGNRVVIIEYPIHVKNHTGNILNLPVVPLRELFSHESASDLISNRKWATHKIDVEWHIDAHYEWGKGAENHHQS